MADIHFSPTDAKEDVIKTISYMLHVQQLQVVEENFTKPWGAYWRIADEDIERFVHFYYPNDPVEITKHLQQSPKLLVVAPHQRLSWQYHHRRAEVWKILTGPVKTALSESDEQTEPKDYQVGDLIVIPQGTRHRMIGDENWGLWAELWQHTDPLNPSAEEDNVRVQDDYGREGTNTRN